MKQRMMIAAMAVAMGSSALASVFDDASIWFRGGFDKNGDGVFTADEFVDTTHPKSASSFQTCTIGGTGTIAYEKGAVWSNFNPLSTNNQYYISLKNGDKATADECNSIVAVNPYAGTSEACSNYTFFTRFRWDGKIPPSASDNVMMIFENGRNWAGQRGYSIGLKYFKDTDDFATYWVFGANGDKWNKAGKGTTIPTATNGIKITPGEWYDWVMTVQDNGVNNTAYVRIFRSNTAGTITDGWEGNFYKAPYLNTWLKDAPDRCNSIRMAANTPFTIADKTFSGDIAAWAYWPRHLTQDEIREVMSELRPGDAVFRLGKEDGKSDEFAAEESKQTIVDFDNTWDIVPASLADGEAFTVNFNIKNPCTDNQSFPLNQVLRLVAASGTGAVSVVTKDIDRNTTKRFRKRMIYPGRPADFLIPAGQLNAGKHSLTITFTKTAKDCNAVNLDVVELRGSWTLGRIRWNKLSNNTPFKSTGTSYYDLHNGYWPAMCSGWTNEAEIDSTNPLKSATIRFNMPADLVSCKHHFYISGDQWKEKPTAVDVYVNGVKVWTAPSSSLWQYNVFSMEFPANTFKAGENLIQIRAQSANTSWWGGARGYELYVKDEPAYERPFGMVMYMK